MHLDDPDQGAQQVKIGASEFIAAIIAALISCRLSCRPAASGLMVPT
jgi:hypothetical protein